MNLRILKRFLGLLLGIAPGVVYATCGMVGIGGAALLIGLGGFVGVALTLPSVSARRVVHALAEMTPLAWPVALVVLPPQEERLPPPPPKEGSDPPADPSWLTSNVLALAGLIRAEGAFELLPILGDALEDAGCAETEILNRCRAGECGARILDRLLGPRPGEPAAAPDPAI